MKLTAYEAASDSTRWGDLLEDVRRSFGATSVFLRGSSAPGLPDTPWWVDSGADPGTQALYLQQWIGHDPWALHPSGHRQSKPGRCFIGSQILPWKDLERTGFYNDFGRTAGAKGVMTALVEDDPRTGAASQTKLALFRENGLPEFEPEHLRAFEALQPSLRRALHSFWALKNLRVEASAVEETLEAMPSPVFVLRRDRSLAYTNGLAQALQARGFVRAPFGRLAGIAQLDGSRLQDLLDSAAAGIPQEVGLWNPEPDHVSIATLHLARVLPESVFAAHWPRAEILVVIQLDNAVLAKEARMQAVAVRFELTAVQVQVLTRLGNGESTEAVAQAQGVRLSTVRTHIRNLLERTHSRRLVDLLRMIGD